MTVTCDIGGRTCAQNKTNLAPGQWRAVLVDLAGVSDAPPRPGGAPTLTFSIAGPGPVWCDDIMLIDNTQWLVGSEESAAAGKWSVNRRGLNYVCDVPGKFTVRLSTSEAISTGWHVEEANEIRARFASNGKEKLLTIFPDGRSYWDGSYRPLEAELRRETLWAEQQSSPAQIEIPETMGRLERRSPGDANNDGYNESRAAYQIIAAGPRLEATIVPQSVPVLRPMLEISGLPPGKVLVTIEGRLIDQVLRFDDGTLLVEIPGKIERPTEISLRVQ